jgi:biopolymer transport protein ExbB/TolQ
MAKRHADAAAPLDRWRPFAAMIGALIGLVLAIVLFFVLPEYWAVIFVGYLSPTFPISVQNCMWVFFGVALAELLMRYLTTRVEEKQLQLGLLPEDERAVLTADDLPAIYQEIRSLPDSGRAFLPRLIQRSVLQFQASGSVDQASSLLNTSIEMYLHEVDLRYNMIRYLSWAIPSLGFIGTVIGIGAALEYAGHPENAAAADLLTIVTQKLAVAFNGTLVALLLASVVVFLQTVIQGREEHSLNSAGQYCLDNLINRLYLRPGEKADK